MKFLALSAASLAMAASMAMAQDVVRMGTEGAYPPWNYIDDNGEVAGFERGLFPTGDWSILTTWSKFSSPSIPPCDPGNCLERCKRWAADLASTSFTNELLPEPETPQTTVSNPTGKEALIFCKLFARASFTSTRSFPGFFLFPFFSIHSFPLRKDPLRLCLD